MLKKDDNAIWSWDGALALVQYLEDLEDSTNTKIEFDPILFRCEYSEYSSVLKAGENYSFIPPEDRDQEEIEAAALEYLQNKTTVIQFEGGIIIQQF